MMDLLTPAERAQREEEKLAHRRRLVWQYGAQRADEILAGVDPATERDLAAWRRMGGTPVQR